MTDCGAGVKSPATRGAGGITGGIGIGYAPDAAATGTPRTMPVGKVADVLCFFVGDHTGVASTMRLLPGLEGGAAAATLTAA